MRPSQVLCKDKGRAKVGNPCHSSLSFLSLQAIVPGSSIRKMRVVPRSPGHASKSQNVAIAVTRLM